MNSLRYDYARSFINKGFINQEKENSTIYLSTLTNDIQSLEEQYFNVFPRLIANFFLVVFSFIKISKYSLQLAIFGVVVYFPLIILPLISGSEIRIRNTHYFSSLNDMYSRFNDIIQGHDTINSYKVNDIICSIFEKKLNETYTKNVGLKKYQALINGMSNLFAYFAQLSYVLFCGYLVITKNFSVGTVVACIQLSNQFVSPTLSIIDDFNKLKANSEIRSRIIDMLNYNDTKDNGLLENLNIDKVVCENISFSYDNKVIIQNFNHVFEKGKKYLIIGPSGSGKTTLLNIIANRNKNFNGSIKYYNENKLIDDVGNSISFCEQNVFLFEDTILHNITMFKDYSESKINKVINECEINRVLDKNDLNLNSKILENGKNLSGGQKQIIAIARALLRDASICIFDEPTSSLDKKTSIIIHEALKRIDGILIEVTHDKSEEIIAGFDEIIEIK